MADYIFYAFFVASKVGKTGLTPTVDVWGAGGAEVTAANAATIGGGLYSYTHTDATPGDYTAVFKTSDATVDQQWIPALCVKQLSAYVDAAISSRSTLTAQQVWEYASRTLSSLGTLIADVWAYVTRTLTQSAASVAASVAGSSIIAQRGDTLVVALTGLGNIAARTKLWFTVKADLSQTDAQAILLIEETAGLTVVNSAVYAIITDGSIVVTDAATGALTITLKPAVTKDLSDGSGYHYDMQYLTAAGVVATLTAGTFMVSADITRAVS